MQKLSQKEVALFPLEKQAKSSKKMAKTPYRGKSH